MKILRLLVVVLLLASLTLGSHVSAAPQEAPFSVYSGDAPWKKQRFFLDDLAIYLQRQPEMTGYIVYYSSKNLSQDVLKRRVNQSVKYLTGIRGIERRRLRVCYGGNLSVSKIVLQPLETAEGSAKIVGKLTCNITESN